jgi:hypothetical protein
MALPAGIAAVAVDAGPAVAIVVAAGFGVVAGLVGEFGERALYAHGDTHFDPPMVAILITSLLLTGLAAAGVLEPGPIPYPGV